VAAVLVPTVALLLDGDSVALSLTVAPHTALEIAEVGATVAYGGPGRGARLDTRIRLGEGATLVWAAQPLVVAATAVVARDLTVELAEGASALLRETLVLGRSGEPAGRLRARTRVTGPGGPVLTEDLTVGEGGAGGEGGEGADHALPGLWGGHRVLDTALLLGRRPDPPPPDALDLAQPGAVYRRLADAAHTASVEAVFESWRPAGAAPR
jgi:urease accessory protein